MFVLQDDDSDLEYELEAFPEVSTEASAEASACVKVINVWTYKLYLLLCIFNVFYQCCL